MKTICQEKDLQSAVTVEMAVSLAYATELADTVADLRRGLPVMVECEKELVGQLFMAIRGRLKTPVNPLQCMFLDGRPRNDQEAQMGGFVNVMMHQLREAVRGATEQKVLVLPHLDLLTTSQGSLTSEAREVIPLLYENPTLVWLGFKDPSFPVPTVIDNLFPRRVAMLGIPRGQLAKMVTQVESRKFGREFNPWSLYKHVSGMNAVRLRRLLSTLEGEDYPADPREAIKQIRAATTAGQMQVPDVSLTKHIGGYAKVKNRLQTEIIDVLAIKDQATDDESIRNIEALLPRGMIFWGPPGTGKTMFAKAMATSLGAAITVVSGPELKSRWVGESEEQLRQLFHRARQSAPSVIVFDEMDSFASARGTYTGSGVEHSMVNQLLTEMDGFRKEELVFVVGTTNFVEILDPALLRPGRFEFHLHIPYPEAEDRREILKIYDKSMRLCMTDEALDTAVTRTAGMVEGAGKGTRFSGDHLNALCRSIARSRLRSGTSGPTEPRDIDRALLEWVDRPKMTQAEELVVATHEAGHAIVAMHCKTLPPIEHISIRGDMGGALGFVRHKAADNKFVVTKRQMLEELQVLLGGQLAEKLLLDDVSIGAASDLARATDMARAMVEELGMAELPGAWPTDQPRQQALSQHQLQAIELQVTELLQSATLKARHLLTEHRGQLVTLRDLLLERKSLEVDDVFRVTRAKTSGVCDRASRKATSK